MSCGFTNETVVHHGSAPPSSALNHSRSAAAIFGSLRQPCPGAAVGRRVHAAGEAVALERCFAERRRPVVVVVGQVPLAEPARVVAVLAQHRAPGREARIERAAARDHAARLVRVEPGQHRRARPACSRWRPCSGARTRPPLRAGAEGWAAASGAHRGRAEPLREAQLVDDDHEDVGALPERAGGRSGPRRRPPGPRLVAARPRRAP